MTRRRYRIRTLAHVEFLSDELEADYQRFQNEAWARGQFLDQIRALNRGYTDVVVRPDFQGAEVTLVEVDEDGDPIE
jgi:hypothetical protein